MKNIYYSVIAILCLLIIVSCSESSPTSTENGASSTMMYQLVASADPSEAGSVSPTSNEYEEGTSVEITATANNNWVFQKWQGGNSGSSNPASVTMDKDRQVTAYFVKIQFALKKEIEGEGNIYERVIQQKASHHSPGTIVEVVAVPETGWRFSHWAGDLDGSENPVSIAMNSEKTVKAVFERKDYDLTIEVDGTGAVSEEVVQAKTTEYPYQTVVNLTADAGEGWEFNRWEGDLSGSNNPTQIEITESKNVKAVFVRQFFDLKININGEGTVSENLVSGKETDGKYEYESEVELTAEPEVGYQFKNWSGDIESTDNPITVNVTGDTEITAVFEDADYTLTIEIQGEGQVEQEVVQSKSTTYPGGTEVKLTALSEGDWRFIGWKEGASGTDNVTTIILDRDLTVIASFDNKFEGGDGSEMYPYKVETLNQLQAIIDYADKHFIQINDIDAKETENWNDGQGFEPIGDSIIKFTGAYDGNDYIISELSINRDSRYIGFFARTNGAIIENVSLTQVNIKGDWEVGSLIGRKEGGKVINTNVSGRIEAYGRYVGGLVGYILSDGIVTNSISSVEVWGDDNFSYMGGLVGHTSFGTLIEYSSASGNVNGGSSTGGLVGSMSGTDIISSYATGNVNGVNFVGGLAGYNYRGEINMAYASGNVQGKEHVGGLIGSNQPSIDRRTIILNSYSVGDVQGESAVGGLLGTNTDGGEVLKSFSIGNVNGQEDVGGFAGLNAGTIEFGFWDFENSENLEDIGRGSSNNVMGLTTSEMQGTAAAGNMPEFDWDNIWMTTTEYPILRWQEE